MTVIGIDSTVQPSGAVISASESVAIVLDNIHILPAENLRGDDSACLLFENRDALMQVAMLMQHMALETQEAPSEESASLPEPLFTD